MEIGDQITLMIDGISSDGAGVGHFLGMAVFVPGVLPQEKVQARVEKTYPRYARARLEQVLKASPDRVSPRCPHFLQCGGCAFLHMPYPLQLEIKQKIVSDAFSRIGKLQIPIEPVLPCPNPFHYRNKASFPVNRQSVGYYAAATHQIIDIDGCPLTDPRISNLLFSLKDWVKAIGLRHLVLRAADDGVMAILVAPQKGMVSKDEAIARMAPLGIASIYVNVNASKTILTDRMTWLYGKKHLTQTVCGNCFPVSPLSFFQVNTRQCEALYARALSMLDFTGKRVADAYCGVGTITLAVSKRAAHVTGIEEVGAAVDNAKAAAKDNAIQNVAFVQGKCEQVLPRLLQTAPVDAILLDPPRGGLKPAVIQGVTACGVKEVVYISCSPQTLARDAARFNEAGYAIQKVAPVDMFPQTPDVECVCLLTKAQAETCR